MGVRVVINDAKIVGHFTPVGTVGKHALKVASEAKIAIQAQLVPSGGFGRGGFRTGHLQRSVYYRGGGVAAALDYRIRLGASAYYAKWVEHGTGDAHLLEGQARLLKAYPPRYPRATWFRGDGILGGQRGQHFLREGMNIACHANGYRSVTFE